MAAPILVVMAGLPGTGKTTLAKLLVRKLSAAYLRTDPIAAALLRANLTDEAAEAGRAAYLVAESFTRENLENDIPVVVDGVNASHERRAIWPKVAHETGVPITMFETTLLDADEHRRRLDEREFRSEPHSVSPWESVVRMSYTPWDSARYGERRVVDMADTTAGLTIALDEIQRAYRRGGSPRQPLRR